jgi:Mrp family chromosome partitioning ATPase
LSEDRGSARRLPFAIVLDRAGGAHVLVAKPMADLAPAFLRSERLRLLFANARTHYDLIIIDGPPLLATADSLLLAGHADQALLLAASGRTDASSLAAAVRRLSTTGCEIEGVVFNKCPAPVPKEFAFAGYVSQTRLTSPIA